MIARAPRNLGDPRFGPCAEFTAGKPHFTAEAQYYRRDTLVLPGAALEPALRLNASVTPPHKHAQRARDTRVGLVSLVRNTQVLSMRVFLSSDICTHTVTLNIRHTHTERWGSERQPAGPTEKRSFVNSSKV